MMDFLLEMMDFILEIMNFVFKNDGLLPSAAAAHAAREGD